MSYKGRISTTGTSEAIRLDKDLFRQHPEFRQKAEVRADVIGPGKLLISVTDSLDKHREDDPVVGAFLAFIEKDILDNPHNVTPISKEQIRKAKALTAKVKVSDNELE